jgi:hypothetical protein
MAATKFVFFFFCLGLSFVGRARLVLADPDLNTQLMQRIITFFMSWVETMPEPTVLLLSSTSIALEISLTSLICCLMEFRAESTFFSREEDFLFALQVFNRQSFSVELVDAVVLDL